MANVAEFIADSLIASGVGPVYGIAGDSQNGSRRLSGLDPCLRGCMCGTSRPLSAVSLRRCGGRSAASPDHGGIAVSELVVRLMAE
jgi:hypothetical protein